jgi:hypothetical protein
VLPVKAGVRQRTVAVSTLQWAGGNFDPGAIDPAAVTFDDPKKRWKKAFER